MNKIKHKCPFCGEWVEHWESCNGFCRCSAKYYSSQQVWLNRKTGETRKVDKSDIKEMVNKETSNESSN